MLYKSLKCQGDLYSPLLQMQDIQVCVDQDGTRLTAVMVIKSSSPPANIALFGDWPLSLKALCPARQYIDTPNMTTYMPVPFLSPSVTM